MDHFTEQEILIKCEKMLNLIEDWEYARQNEVSFFDSYLQKTVILSRQVHTLLAKVQVGWATSEGYLPISICILSLRNSRTVLEPVRTSLQELTVYNSSQIQVQ